jgi:DNA polymerase-3 subunit gamma/tau
MKMPESEAAPVKVVSTDGLDLALEKVIEAVPPRAPAIAKKVSWEGFLDFLNQKSPASASNLEQGNITSPIRLENGELNIELGFGYSGLVFLDYLSEPEVFQKLINNLSEYFEVEKNKINLSMQKVQSAENFISTAEIKEQQAEMSMQERVENFKKNPLLVEAEKIFNAKVDKVIIASKK